MSWIVPLEDHKDSDQLERIELKVLARYAKDSIMLEGARVDCSYDAMVYRILLRALVLNKHFSVAFDRSDTVGHFKAAVDKMLYKIQEALDEEPEDAQVHTSPKPGAYAPNEWAKKVAKKALRI